MNERWLVSELVLELVRPTKDLSIEQVDCVSTHLVLQRVAGGVGRGHDGSSDWSSDEGGLGEDSRSQRHGNVLDDVAEVLIESHKYYVLQWDASARERYTRGGDELLEV